MSEGKHSRVHELAKLALGMANSDVAAAAHLLSEWAGLSLSFALAAIEEIVVIEEPPERAAPIGEDEPL
jgi:cell division protein FtsL